jgi:hypothetical protein
MTESYHEIRVRKIPNVSSNHHNCKKVLIFKAPKKYPPPICNMLTKLQIGGQISHNEIVLFKLAMAIEYDLPYNSSAFKINKNKICKQMTLFDVGMEALC